MHRVAAAVVALAVTASAVYVAQRLADWRVKLDAALAAEHAAGMRAPRYRGRSGASTDGRATSNSPLRRTDAEPTSAEPARIAHIRIYWPRAAARAGRIVGWCFTRDARELIAVVAGVGDVAAAPLDGVLPLEQLGMLGIDDAAHGAASANATVQLHATGYDTQDTPVWTRIASNHALSAACTTTTILYTVPDPLRFESYVLGAAPRDSAHEWTRLEHFLATDAARFTELSHRGPGGLRAAVALMNVSCWSMAAPSRRTWAARRHPHAWRLSLPQTCRCSATLRTLRAYTALIPAYAASADAHAQVYAWVQRQGPRPDVAQCAAAARRFRDGVGVLLLDVALGQVLAVVIERHADMIARAWYAALTTGGAVGVHEINSWLAHWPMGLKLNTELALFLGDVLAGITDAYDTVLLAHARAHGPVAVAAATRIARYAGASVALSTALDAVRLLSMHMAAMQALLRHVYVFFTHAVTSLFDLFRGKKRNPLHGGRLDDAHYELDQLFLGTILITLLAFLFPTVMLYYTAYSLGALCVLVLRAGLATPVAVLHALPPYTLLLRVCEPLGVAGGVAFVRVSPQALAMCACAQPLGAVTREACARVRGLCALPQLAFAAVVGRALALDETNDSGCWEAADR